MSSVDDNVAQPPPAGQHGAGPPSGGPLGHIPSLLGHRGVPTWFEVALPPVALLIVAVFLWAGPLAFTSPVPPAQSIPAWATEVTTAQHPNLKPEAHFGHRTYACSICHTRFSAVIEPKPDLYFHRSIVLQHGRNDRCYNCHDPNHMNALIDDWGQEISYDQPQMLCRKCHGEVYRDWLNGAHGRTNGYWRPSLAPASTQPARLRHVCDECHNPHRPPFQPMQPAPAPRTLRMGPQPFGPEHPATVDPLRVYTHAPTMAPTPPPEEEEFDMPVPVEGS